MACHGLHSFAVSAPRAGVGALAVSHFCNLTSYFCNRAAMACRAHESPHYQSFTKITPEVLRPSDRLLRSGEPTYNLGTLVLDSPSGSRVGGSKALVCLLAGLKALASWARLELGRSIRMHRNLKRVLMAGLTATTFLTTFLASPVVRAQANRITTSTDESGRKIYVNDRSGSIGSAQSSAAGGGTTGRS